jgi:hypothetical protein
VAFEISARIFLKILLKNQYVEQATSIGVFHAVTHGERFSFPLLP